MKAGKYAVAILLAGLQVPAMADEYQDAVTKAFPGFQILGPSDVRLNKNEMRPEVYEQVKDHPGLVVGRLDADKLADFGALIRGSTKKTQPEDKSSKRPAMDYYDGYLVFCFGLGAGGYRCEKLATSPLKVFVPHRDFLTRISTGRASCTVLRKFKAPKPRSDPNVLEPEEGPEEIKFGTDAIGLMGSDAVVYVSQPRGMYIECRVGG